MRQAAQVSGYEGNAALYMAMELSNRRWRLGFSNGSKMRQKTVESGDTEPARAEVLRQISLAKEKLGLPPSARVVACYEAGRDGHWIARWLGSEGVEVMEISSSSIEKPQGRKHVKTDRVDVEKLLDLLMRYCHGFRRGFKPVRVPSEEAEAAMRLHRDDETLVKERGRLVNQMRALLAKQGVKELVVTGDFDGWLEGIRLWHGGGLHEADKRALKRLYRRYELVREQLREVAAEYEAEVGGDTVVGKQRRQLEVLKGIGPKISRVLSAEAFAWREFRNAKEVGALSGLTPTPSQSGDLAREQGIDKHGIRRLRRIAIEMAWLWVRWQPNSALSHWFCRRFAGGGKRMRRVGIVALARKLLIALWKYLEHGVVPEGAIVSPAR